MNFPGHHGVLTVSLDFELYWGVRDLRSIESYRENLLGVRRAIPALLDLFREFGIHATWATVGFLFFSDKQTLLNRLPPTRPQYSEPSLDPYADLDSIGLDEDADPFRFAPSLIRRIAETPFQEIGTHTFSHFYCLEPGQDVQSFESDLVSAIAAAQSCGRRVTSLVFPRNQVNEEYLRVCVRHGIRAVRGNPDHWLYRARAMRDEYRWHRALRLIDHYLPLSGSRAYSISRSTGESPVDVKASRFLRHYSPRLRYLDPVRLTRIKRDMDRAAKENKIFHLWWHPHNFGVYLDENLNFLRAILQHFALLHQTRGMQSLSMAEIAERVEKGFSGNA